MAQLGLKYPVYAPATESGTSITYNGGAVLAKAVSSNISITTSDVKLYADDAVAESDHSFSTGTITIEVDNLNDDAKKALLGYTEASGSTGELQAPAEVVCPNVGFGFYSYKMVNNVAAYRAIWLTKVQFSEPSEDFSTKGESTEFKTTSLTGTIMKAANGLWKVEQTFATEAEAKAYLDKKAGIAA